MPSRSIPERNRIVLGSKWETFPNLLSVFHNNPDYFDLIETAAPLRLRADKTLGRLHAMA